jgi:hypothetical protein
VTWIDDRPVLELQDLDGNAILAGSQIELGDVEPFQVQNVEVLAYNPSTITALEISSVDFENLVNVVNLQLEPGTPFDVGLEAEQSLLLSFEVPSSGPFSFDVLLEHNGSNPTPFSFSGVGSGLYSSNPIQLVDVQPASPGSSMIEEFFDLVVNVELDAPAEGVLQVEVLDQENNPAQEPICQVISSPGLDNFSFEFSFTENVDGLQDYQIWARYRDLNVCPIEDQNEYDISQGYLIDWQEDHPVMEVKNVNDEALPSGGSDDLGGLEAYQAQSVQYLINNPSTTTGFQITGAIFDNLVNLASLEFETETPVSIGPGEEAVVGISYEIENPGDFSFDVNLDHDASNPTPYSFSVFGNGILESNPIQSLTPEPLSPGMKLIGEVFGLVVDTLYDAPIEGSLVVNLLDQENNPIQDAICQEITEIGSGDASASFAWSEDGVVLNDYTILAEFFSRGGCPVEGEPISELSMSYQVDWQEELPILEIAEKDGTLIPADEMIDLGQFEYYQTVDLSYVIRNISSTSSLEITDVRLENLSNLSKVDSNPQAGFTLAPEGEKALDIAFTVDSTGSFSFDLVIDHQASNPTPYTITFQGSGVMTNNPIKFIVATPPTPGSSLIGSDFPLRVEVGMEAPDTGALQLTVIDNTSDETQDQECLLIEDNLDQARTFNLSWTSSDPGSREYSILARYRAQGECPISNSQDSDLTQKYLVNWEEDLPELEVSDQMAALVSNGESINLGQKGFYEHYELTYTLTNNSTTSSMEVVSISVENQVNLDAVTVDPSGPLTLGPGEDQQVQVAFQVTEIGTFSFELAIEHDGNNASPYRFSILGSGELVKNPIYGMTLIPVSPANLYTSEIFELQIQSEINPPAPGAIEIVVLKEMTDDIVGSSCLAVLDEHSLLNVDLSWTESISGDVIYQIQLRYHAGDSCPTDGEPDAELMENYQVYWQTHKPVLIVNRPEGVTIFDGAVDYVGEHDFFRFVEVTYVIENKDDSAPLVIDNILADNLENLREVLIDPIGPIVIAPGESQEIKINFQILMLEPFSFDLIWEHNGSNSNPYITSIEGTSRLYLGDGVPEQSWLYRFVESLIRSGFFLKIPNVWVGK